ncbi:porin [Pandoraea sputorum]|uniref:porin n=1 Tax=Pandoraea sputorum TaxID=93222 RepID=UPI0012419D4A|nr:porin [Pandoraea sputorum]VVE81661.1 porin [Pandoraea sputorum]
MKKTLLLLAIAGGSLSTSFAVAADSVTLYGILDNSLQYVKNAGNEKAQFGLVGGQLSGNRWGLLGEETLDATSKVIFRLESGFNVNTGVLGQGGLMFGRQAYVGINHATAGTFTIGRQFDTLRDLVLPVQGNSVLEFYSSPGDVDAGDATIRMNNAVKWLSPNWSGLQAGATYSFGGIAGAGGSGQTWSLALSYTLDRWKLAGGFLHVDNGNGATSARGVTTSASIFSTPVNAAYSTARSYNILRVATNYDFGDYVAGAYYSFSQYVPDAYSKFSGTQRYSNISPFVLWKATPNFMVELGYNFMKASGNSSAIYQHVSVAVDYLLSKRTDVYGIVAGGHATGNNGSGPAMAYIGDASTASVNASQLLLITGIRHRF